MTSDLLEPVEPAVGVEASGASLVVDLRPLSLSFFLNEAAATAGGVVMGAATAGAAVASLVVVVVVAAAAVARFSLFFLFLFFFDLTLAGFSATAAEAAAAVVTFAVVGTADALGSPLAQEPWLLASMPESRSSFSLR